MPKRKPNKLDLLLRSPSSSSSFSSVLPKAAADSPTAAGSALPLGKLVAALLAISFGTVLEWYDYSVYTQLSGTLRKVFFPSNDPALQALSFYGVYAVGFVSRPAGALLLGHLGDTRGRGFCLIVSIVLMGIPSVLIGCLPTYAQAGLAAPIMLAVLRLVQGLAMGGEFGAAMVYLYELAHSRHKGVTGSVGYISLGAGVVLGILVVNAVLSTVTDEAHLLSWGWRVPFLVASVSLAAGVVLRYNMPESMEFNADHEQLNEQYNRRLQHKQKQARQQHKQQQEPHTQQQPGAEAQSATAQPSSAVGAAEEGRGVAVAVGKDADCTDLQECNWADEGGESGADSSSRRHYVPVCELFRDNWLGLVLHVAYASWNAAAFHLGYSWLPNFFVDKLGFSTRLSLWMLLSCMAIFILLVPVAGALSDRGVPRVTTNIVVCCICGVLYVPSFLAFKTGSVLACWLLQGTHLALAAWAMGVLPVIVSRIYSPAVRISGFSLGHNVGATVGGVTPLIITAIQASTGAVFLGPALFMTFMALTSILGSLALVKYYPATNMAP